MSRLAKKPVVIPPGVTVTEKDRILTVKGPKGELSVVLPKIIACTIDGNGAMFTLLPSEVKKPQMFLGTTWSLLRNAIEGVVNGFTKVLEIEGVGYRAAVEGDTLVLALGFVNPVKFKIPAGIAIKVEKNVVTITGISKEAVGQVAAQIRAFKKPEPYKGKGIKYQGEVIRRKVGKKAAATSS